MRSSILSFAFCCLISIHVCGCLDPWQNWTLPISTRVNDLISRLSLREKLGQFTTSSESIDRLNISAYRWGSECLHGIVSSGISTVFPQPIGLAASFNRFTIFFYVIKIDFSSFFLAKILVSTNWRGNQ